MKDAGRDSGRCAQLCACRGLGIWGVYMKVRMEVRVIRKTHELR